MSNPQHNCSIDTCLTADSSQGTWQCMFSSMDTKNSLFFPAAFPLFLQQIINSVTVCSKAPCLVVHIQSCRLKQIAICIPLGKKAEGSTIPHPISASRWILRIWSSKSLFSSPSCWDRHSKSGVRAITAISVFLCQADWKVAAKTKEWAANHCDGGWFCGVKQTFVCWSAGVRKQQQLRARV